MPLDGCFIHYLVNELNTLLSNGKLNKVYQPNNLDLVLQIRCSDKTNQQLLISSRLDTPKIYLTNGKYKNPEAPNNFCMVLRKYIERGIISSITQYQNDRIIQIKINTFNELDDEKTYFLIIELMGRNSNIILVNDTYCIIDAIRKLPPSSANLRTIIPHAKYQFPSTNQLVNPFIANQFTNLLSLQGVSKPLLQQLQNLTNDEISAFFNQPIKPIIYQNGTKIDFYMYHLSPDDQILFTAPTLSEMLEMYYTNYKVTSSDKSIVYERSLKKELKKALHKQTNLLQDLDEAQHSLENTDLGILLQANLYQVKKGDTFIQVNDFLHSNELVTINLDPTLDPSTNLKLIFTKIKKAKTAIIELDKQIKIVNCEIEYLTTLLFQLSICNEQELAEIALELVANGIIKKNKNVKNKNQTPTFLTYLIDDVTIYVGKNNYQNDYLTHKLAKSNDYWFHVKDMPGSHVIVKLPNNNSILTEKLIRNAAMIAAYYSKAKDSSSVPVDYTQVKYLKKVPGMKGSFVTLSNQKTIYIDPDKTIIDKYLNS